MPGEPVTDVLFSTFWINHGVFNAVAVQQGYSRAYGVNFIASNVAVCPKNCGGGEYTRWHGDTLCGSVRPLCVRPAPSDGACA